ncbi:MAG: HIT family protein [Planctomycetota bacterium]|jgi:ATP adenylyltransferase
MNNDNLWAPWRMAYLKDLKRRAESLGKSDLESGPFLSEYFQHPQDDEANHVVFRNDHGIVLLNRYPYVTGHLLVALGDPRPTLLDYTPDQRAEFWKLIEIGTELVQRTLRPQGINTGINQGRAAGAGLPDHLHAHIVPRWHADTNFMSVVPQVRVIPEALDVMAEQFRATSRALAAA